MAITFSRLEELDFDFSHAVFKSNNDPEVAFFALNVEESLSNQPVVDRPKNHTTPFIFFGIRWILETVNKATKKQILIYDACAWYSSDLETFKNKDELLKTIRDSFERVSDEYDIKIKYLGIRKKFSAPSEFEFVQTLAALLKT